MSEPTLKRLRNSDHDGSHQERAFAKNAIAKSCEPAAVSQEAQITSPVVQGSNGDDTQNLPATATTGATEDGGEGVSGEHDHGNGNDKGYLHGLLVSIRHKCRGQTFVPRSLLRAQRLLQTCVLHRGGPDLHSEVTCFMLNVFVRLRSQRQVKLGLLSEWC